MAKLIIEIKIPADDYITDLFSGKWDDVSDDAKMDFIKDLLREVGHDDTIELDYHLYDWSPLIRQIFKFNKETAPKIKSEEN